MVAFSALGVALVTLLQPTGALRTSSTKAVGGVKILNYRYRHMQVGTMDGKFDWVLKFEAGQATSDLLAFCGGEAGQSRCSTVGHPTEGGAPLATVRATEDELEQLFQGKEHMIEWAEPDTPVELEPAEEVEVAASSGNVWGPKTIGLTRSSFSGKGVHIYVMDTGIRISHEEFGGRAVATIDTILGAKIDGSHVTECTPEDVKCGFDGNGHGTHVAGTAGGRTFGVARDATLHAMKVCCGSQSHIIAGMDWLATGVSRPAVMTMSLGSDSIPESSRVAVDAVVKAGITVTVSAGNRGSDSCLKSYTFIASAVGVGASDEKDVRASFSNYGTCNAIFAPGVNIVSAWYRSDKSSELHLGYKVLNGTSMATPLVAGVTALLLEQDGTRSPGKIRELLQTRARKGALQKLKAGDPNLLLWAGDAEGPAPVCPFHCGREGRPLCYLFGCKRNCHFCQENEG